MGVEVKSGGEGVIVADRGCNDGCCCNNHNSGLIMAGNLKERSASYGVYSFLRFNT